MTHQLFALILLSSAIHAWWNFVLKRAGGGLTFVALSKLVEVGLGAIPFLLGSGVSGELIRRHGSLLVVGGLLTLLSYTFLTLAYRREQMSTVYAISRGGSLALLPVLAWIFRGEHSDGLGFAAMGSIILGIALMQVPVLTRKALFQTFAATRNPATCLAWLTAFTIAGYSLWDALAVRVLPPFFYL
jgi:multidrug transporter EmrE-like cation transporter